MGESAGKTMGVNRLAVTTELAIPFVVFGAGPRPARAVAAGLIKPRPKLVAHGSLPDSLTEKLATPCMEATQDSVSVLPG